MIGSSPKVRASSETIGRHQRARRSGSRTRLRSRRAKTMVVETAWVPEPGGELLEDLGVGPQRRASGRTTRTGSGPSSTRPRARRYSMASEPSARADVGRVALERGVGDVVGQVEAVAQRAQLRLGHLLDLVGGVARLDLGPERPALDRLGQDHRGRALLLGGQLVGGVELAVVVAAAGQRDELVVAQVLDHLAQAGVGAEEVLADVGPGLDGQLLVLAVDRGVHAVEQDAVDVLGQQRVPARAPDHLDHVPAGAPEDGLELLDDLAVAPHRPVEALQVAVDDEDQVVEVLAAGHAEGADRLGLVHLAVAHEAPDPAGAGVDQPAQVEVAVDVGLVDGGDRARGPSTRSGTPRSRAASAGGDSWAARRRRPRGGSCRAAPRSAGPRRRPGRRCRARRDPGRRPGRRSRRRPCPGRSG